MTKQTVAIGATANDGTGDSIRDAFNKLNQNMTEIYQKLGGDSAIFMAGIEFDSTAISLLGTQSTFRTRIEPVNPTSNQTIYVPDSAGTLLLRESNTYTTIMDNITVVDSVASVDRTKPLTIFNRSGTIAASLDSGLDTGHVIKFVNEGTGAVTLTPNFFAQGTSVVMQTDACCEMVWGTAKWHLFGNTDSDAYLTIS